MEGEYEPTHYYKPAGGGSVNKVQPMPRHFRIYKVDALTKEESEDWFETRTEALQYARKLPVPFGTDGKAEGGYHWWIEGDGIREHWSRYGDEIVVELEGMTDSLYSRRAEVSRQRHYGQAEYRTDIVWPSCGTRDHSVENALLMISILQRAVLIAGELQAAEKEVE